MSRLLSFFEIRHLLGGSAKNPMGFLFVTETCVLKKNEGTEMQQKWDVWRSWCGRKNIYIYAFQGFNSSNHQHYQLSETTYLSRISVMEAIGCIKPKKTFQHDVTFVPFLHAWAKVGSKISSPPFAQETMKLSINGVDQDLIVNLNLSSSNPKWHRMYGTFTYRYHKSKPVHSR